MKPSRADVLIMGGGGPIGKALANLLRNEGIAVAATSRLGGAYPLDVRNPIEVRNLLSALRPEAVAYLVNPVLQADANAKDVDAWAAIARRTAEEACEAGVSRFVFASSAAVYGDDQAEPRTEESPLRGRGAYASLKIASEVALQGLGGLPMSILSARIFNVYGPGCTASLINRLSDRGIPDVYSTPFFVRDYVHVVEVASALRIALWVQDPDVAAVNVGSGRAVSNLMLMRRVPAEMYRAVEAPGMRSFSVADPSRAASLLGWRASANVLASLPG